MDIKKRILLFFFQTLVCTPIILKAQKKLFITSPDRNLVFSLEVKRNIPSYSIRFKKEEIIKPSILNLEFENKEFLIPCTFSKSSQLSEGTDKYNLVVGKTSSVNQSYHKGIIFLKAIQGNKYLINLEVKVFNDGLAFRYIFPKQPKKTNFLLLDEKTEFQLSGNPVVKTLFFPNYTSSHEGLYKTLPFSEIKKDTLMDLPNLYIFNNKTYLAITEAALKDYAGMYLIKHNASLFSSLSPLPGGRGVKVKGSFPHLSPWRVFLISDRIGSLIESNIITNLNEPCAYKDISWIKTGTTTFPWWNGTLVPDTSFTPGNNFETNKYYIDFCANNHIFYHSVVEFGGHEWYTNNGGGYQPGTHCDVTKPVDGLDMKQICDYATRKDVGIRVWVHWKAIYPQIDSAFTVFEKWGIKGMMVDFMDRDDQEMVNIQTEILQKAAAHHLHIQFHGSFKPTGLSRTYPNEFTREGTLNYENDKWSNLITPDEDINIPFTRMLAGSTDYHLGGFRALNPDKFKIQYIRPYVMGTRCHMLGMYIVLENYQGMVCDYPEAYIGEPGFEVLKYIPTTWDETKVIDAKLDQYISIARLKGKDWYLGTINNHEAREITLPLSFLSEGNYSAIQYSDHPENYQNPNLLIKQFLKVYRSETLKLKLASGGGNVIIFHKEL